MPTCPTCRAQFGDDVDRCPVDDEALLPDQAFTSADVDLRAGDMVGEYKVEGKLGEGGFGAVYRAVHPVIGKTAAVKVLSRQWSSNPQMVSRFISEARAVNQIRHKNIIDIFAFGALPDGRQYYVMELLDGMPFDKFLREKGRLAPETALPLLRAVARALDAAHANGIVHRDLKPENVFLCFDEDGTIQPRLLDFGIAKLLGESISGHKTRTGTPMGTPGYMSPEQCRGKAVDKRTDVYALGVMAHELLTGRLPFEGESAMDVLVRHMAEPAPAMTAHCPELPAALDAPVKRMLEKEPEQRPASAGEAVDAIVAAAGGAGIAVPNVAAANVPALPARTRIASMRPTATPPSQIESAKTVASSDAPGRTFMGSEADVSHGPRKRTLLVSAVVAVACLGVGATAVFFATRHPGEGTTTAAGMTQAPTGSTPAAGASLAAPPTAATSAALPSEVNVTVEGTPPHATVWVGASRVGDAPGPIKLARGEGAVTLTVKADGYAPATADVVPTNDVVVAVKLTKLATGAGSATGGKRLNKELESPF
jgi:serine/threonine protein kinase